MRPDSVSDQRRDRARPAFLDSRGAPVHAAAVPLLAYESLHALVPPPEAGREVLFLGSYSHARIEDGADKFATEVWPPVREATPGLRLCLVAGDDIVLAGQVSEATLSQHYDAACVAIAPLRFGAGLKGKLTEAMHHGVPCVTIAVSAQGLDTGGFIHNAESPESFAAVVCTVARDVNGWQEASSSAQAYVAARFAVHAVSEVLGTMMRHAPFGILEERRHAVTVNRGKGYRPGVPAFGWQPHLGNAGYSPGLLWRGVQAYPVPSLFIYWRPTCLPMRFS